MEHTWERPRGLGVVSPAPALVFLLMFAFGGLATARAEDADPDEMPSIASSTSAQAADQPAPFPPLNLYSLLTRESLIAEIESRHAAAGTFPEMLERLTRGLLGAPYLVSPLGEGEMPDPDPRFRLDAFDCTTFVETAIAFAHCDDLDAIARMLDKIRYQGDEHHFNERRHLITSQWIPDLVALGLLEDVTSSVGGDATRWVKLELTPARWKHRRIARTLALDASEIPVGSFSLPYVPIKVMLARIDRVPPGTIVNVIRSDVPWTPEVITHQGLVLTRPGETTRIVRHASPVSKRVIDETLEHMLTRYLKPRKWPIEGVHLLRIVAP